MKKPDIVTTVHDDKKNITYRILAYRKLSQSEAVQMYLCHSVEIIKPHKGDTLTIETIIGFDE